MKTIKAILLVCLLAIACTQQVVTVTAANPTSAQFNDPAFVKILNNYFGCKTWDNGVCTECSANYYFNANGICCQVQPQCQIFNQAVGICTQCYEGYSVVNGKCALNNLLDPSQIGCKTWSNNVCIECSVQWYFDSNKVCQPVSDLCHTWDASGACLTCYSGYVVSSGACIVDPNAFVPDQNSLCKTWNGRVCVACAARSYFDANGVCTAVSEQCATWDDFSGHCLTCYNGYDLSKEGSCVFSSSNNAHPADIGCKIWDWNNQVCLTCSSNWVFNSKGVCIPVSDMCRTHDASGACVSCYAGYDLNNGVCSYSSSNTAKPADLGCKTWDWTNQKCLACSNNWVFNNNGVCVPVSDNCQSHSASGACTACYVGYDLVNGTCVYSSSNTAKPADLGCKTWDWTNQVCLACSNNWVFNNKGACVPVSDNCQSHDASGACTACYVGYDLVNGTCVYSSSNTAKPADLGCKTWDWTNQKCLACSNNWVFNTKGACIPVADLCASHDASGACLSCFVGYDLSNGQCVYSPSNNAKPADLGCKTWDWTNQKCLACSNNWVFNSNGVCVPVSDMCQSHDASGACTACYKGYDLVNGTCVYSSSNTAKPADLGCKTWDWTNQKCLSCSNNFVFNSNGVCVPVSDLCASHDASGACLSCFVGYDLSNGQCVYSPSNNAKPADLGCKTWDWTNQKCLACSNNWVFNTKGACIPVSDLCASHDASGACLSCFVGYDLSNGQCVYSPSNNAKPADLGCKTWDWTNQKCLACSNNWVFNAKGACVPVSDMCQSHDASGACTACYRGYDLVNGTCVYSSSNTAKPADLGCKTWDWTNQVCLTCSNNWIFNNKGACVPVSDLCASHDASGACLSCFVGYDLTNGQCVYSSSNTAKPADLGCKTWDWTNQKCLACSNNWVFNSNGACVPVSDLCASHDASGACLSCFVGYDLSNGQCVYSPSNNAKPADLGCKTWDWTNQKCLACSNNWVFNSNGACVPVSDNCKSHNSAGACQTCYIGYDLVNGTCVYSSSNTAKPADLGCKTWDWTNQKCLACSNNWVFNTKGACIPVSDLCASHDASGACLSCFVGYDLSNGQCVYSPSNNAKPADLGCKTWDWTNQKCLACSNNWVFNSNGVCVPVSDMCQSHDASGACTACYKGYDLVNGTCVYSSSNTAKPADLGCKTWDWTNQKCLACSNNWVFNNKGACVPVSDLCASHDASGACLSCFVGYDLSNGQCVYSPSNTAKPADLGCKTWDWTNQKCLACSNNWVFNTKGACIPVSDLCASHDASGACLSCFVGYDLTNGQCVYSPANNAKPADLGCKTWDWTNQKCLACSNNWVFNTKGACVPVSDMCQSHDASGACTACYKGYDLVNGTCVFSSSNNAHPADLGCKTWDWDKQVCLACSNNWVFNSKGACVPVSDNCASHDASGACTSCFAGYVLGNGVCQVGNSLCKSADSNGACLTCYNGYVLYKNNCTPISSLADIVLYYTACCPQKLAALKAQGRL